MSLITSTVKQGKSHSKKNTHSSKSFSKVSVSILISSLLRALFRSCLEILPLLHEQNKSYCWSDSSHVLQIDSTETNEMADETTNETARAYTHKLVSNSRKAFRKLIFIGSRGSKYLSIKNDFVFKVSIG